MKRYRRVWTVYRKELIETLRDRRTLMAMVLVPIILYPVLMVVLVEALKSEAGRQEKEQYFVAVPDEAHKAWLEKVFLREEAAREAEETAASIAAEKVGRSAEDATSAFRTQLRAEQITINVVPEDQLWDQVSTSRYHAAVIIEPPPDPKRPSDGRNRVVQILYNDTSPLSEVMHRQLAYVLSNEMDRIVRARVRDISGSEDLLSPMIANTISTTSPDRQFAKALAMIVPFLLVTMTVTGAMYPAIDLTAGERERGTLETLAVSPVPVGQIVAGKFGVIMTIAMVTTTLNLASMTAVIHFSGLDKLFSGNRMEPASVELGVEAEIFSRAADESGMAAAQRDNLQRRREIERESEKSVGFIASAAPIVLVSMIPFAVLFSAVMLAACSFARTFKEAQNYMMPVMMSAIVPAMIVSYMPTVKLEGPMLVIPVANIVVLMRELFLGNYDLSAISLCLGSTCFYAAAAVVVANRIYGNESVLFSDVGSYKTLILRRFMRPQQRPSAAFSLLTVATLFPLYFYAQSGLVDLSAGSTRNLSMIVASQVLFFAAPVLFLTWYTKTDFAETFSLRVPRPAHLLGTMLLVASIAPVTLFLQSVQFYFFPASDALRTMQNQMGQLVEGAPWYVMIVALALTPAICEELLFRGFLMAGLKDRISQFKTILVVGVIFGLFHYQLEKIPIVTLMGIVLAIVCLRSGSIFLAMIVHLANNGVGVAAERFEFFRLWLDLPEDATALPPMEFNIRIAFFLAILIFGLMLFAAKPTRRSDATSPALA